MYRTTTDGFSFLPRPLRERSRDLRDSDGRRHAAARVTKRGALPQFGAEQQPHLLRHRSRMKWWKRALRSIEVGTEAMRAAARDLRVRHRFRDLLRREDGWPGRRTSTRTSRLFVRTGKSVEIGPKIVGEPRRHVLRATPASSSTGPATLEELYWSLGPELFSRDLKDSFKFIEGAPEKLPDAPGRRASTSVSRSATTFRAARSRSCERAHHHHAWR